MLFVPWHRCESQRKIFRSQFSLPTMCSRDQTQVVRLVWQPLLPAAPSSQLRTMSCIVFSYVHSLIVRLCSHPFFALPTLFAVLFSDSPLSFLSLHIYVITLFCSSLSLSLHLFSSFSPLSIFHTQHK